MKGLKKMFNKIILLISILVLLVLLPLLPVFSVESDNPLDYKTIASTAPNIQIQTNERVNLFINNKSHNIAAFSIPELNIDEQIKPNSSKLIELKFNYYSTDKTYIFWLYENGKKVQYATLSVKADKTPEVKGSTRNINLYDSEIVRLAQLKNEKQEISKEEQTAKTYQADISEETTTQTERYIRAYW